MSGEVIIPFNIMAKPVCGRCNLDCAYCYYTMKPDELYPGVEKFQMSDEVLESYIRQYLTAMPVQADFGWQGGEPLLAGKDFFRKVVEYQQKYRVEGQVVNNAMQTNGMLIDDEWCEFFAANKFLVGVSIDGPAQWHDAFRRDHAGNPTFHRAWAALELMRKHDVEFNVLVTLNSANAPHAGDIYRYFTNQGIQYVQFIPILERDENGQPTDFSCTGEQFGRFMLEVFDLWASRDIGRVSERLIDSTLHSLIFGAGSTCCYCEKCANAHVLEFNGDLYACDHFVYERWKIGNIMETPLDQLVRDPKLDEFAKLKTDLPAKCRECEYLSLCRGGCPKHHMPLYGDGDRVNHFCEGYKMFFGETLDELKRMAGYFKRGQTPPLRGSAGADESDPAKAEKFAAGPDASAAGPHKPAGKKPRRNEPCPCGSGRKFKSCCARR